MAPRSAPASSSSTWSPSAPEPDQRSAGSGAPRCARSRTRPASSQSRPPQCPGMTDGRPITTVHRIRDAVNRHDLEAVMACYAPGVRGEEPTLLHRDFEGSDQLRASWEQILAGIPDLRMELVDAVEAGDTVWAEWRWEGSRADGSQILR